MGTNLYAEMDAASSGKFLNFLSSANLAASGPSFPWTGCMLRARIGGDVDTGTCDVHVEVVPLIVPVLYRQV